MRKLEPSLIALLAGWFALSVAALWLRPLWPVDETRYLSVAWEMWLRGDFVVPYINGEPYHHKPPLLFWLMHAGWAIFGVNEWWPRMVAPLCALAAVPLTLRLGRLLWPTSPASATNAVWILFGTLLFAGFVTLTMFDLLLLDCALVAMIGVFHLLKNERTKGLLWFGAGIGLGVLAKGPVILLHVLPAAVAAPWWQPSIRARRGRWYLDLLFGVLIGAAIALAWAGPAAWLGGEVYRKAIFWGQTAGRVSESFAHRAPFWYYLPILPVILFPWLVWPRLWQGARAMAAEWRDPAARFLAAWLVLTLLGFSLVSGKQAKYLVPFLPAFALLAGHALARAPIRAAAWQLWLPATAFLALPAFLAWLRTRPAALRLPEWAVEIPLWPIAALGVLAVVLLLAMRRETALQLRTLSFATLAAAAVLYGGLAPAFAPYGDPAPAARHIAQLQDKGVTVAFLGKYHAQYNFAGRLTRPIAIVDPPELPAWAAAHPGSQVITVERSRHADRPDGPLYQVPFRGAWLQIWRASALLVARPELR